MLPLEPEHPLEAFLSGLAGILVETLVCIVLCVKTLVWIVLGVETLLRIVLGVETLFLIVLGVETLVRIVLGVETLVRIVLGVETLVLDLLLDPPDLPEFLDPPDRTMTARRKMRRVANFILFVKDQTATELFSLFSSQSVAPWKTQCRQSGFYTLN